MADRHEELPLPPGVAADIDATEMVRAWIADGSLHSSVNTGLWHRDGRFEEPVAWGLLLADVARTVADSLHEKIGLDASASLTQILETFNSELISAALAHSATVDSDSELPDASDSETAAPDTTSPDTRQPH